MRLIATNQESALAGQTPVCTLFRSLTALAPPFVEEAAFLDFALNLIALKRALPLEVQLTLHRAIAARLDRRTLLLFDRPVDDLIAHHTAENGTADNGRRPAAAATDQRAERAAGRGTAESAHRWTRRACATAGLTSRDDNGEAHDQTS
jgi:hypothetical protein